MDTVKEQMPSVGDPSLLHDELRNFRAYDNASPLVTRVSLAAVMTTS